MHHVFMKTIFIRTSPKLGHAAHPNATQQKTIVGKVVKKFLTRSQKRANNAREM
jgi:hypothetical protein